MQPRRSIMGDQLLEDAISARYLAESLGQFVALTKPRVMSLAVFTAFVGLWTAPRHLDLIGTVVALVCIALGAGAAGALNMWYDADIDALMTRTRSRPIPRGQRSRREALVLGLTLAVVATAACAAFINVTAAVLLAFTISYYAVVYTIWLKRRSPQSIVIGGAAGALPPVIGWAASGSAISLAPCLLFLIIFLWTPPHFWALAIGRSADYARAGIPALPVVAGGDEAKRQVMRYSVLLVLSSLLPWALGCAGTTYGVSAILLGFAFVGLALKARRSSEAESRPAQRLFAFSIFYLFLLFASLVADGALRRPDRAVAAVVESTVNVVAQGR
jgi:heme o synthase